MSKVAGQSTRQAGCIRHCSCHVSEFRTRVQKLLLRPSEFSLLRPPARSRISLESALCALATSAAYDLTNEDGLFKAPMLWNYQAVEAHDGQGRMRSRWPDQTPGHEYTPIIIVVDNERSDGRAYTDELEFNRLPPSRAKHALGDVPLLVRIQYMNQCHVLNGAAAMALVRYAERRRLIWTIGGRDVVGIGWQWGDAPDGLTLVVNQAGTERVKHQAHAHQMTTFQLAPSSEGDGESGIFDIGGGAAAGTSAARQSNRPRATGGESSYILDLSAAQFGLQASLRCCPGLVAPSAGCAHSPTLARRAAAGIAPGLFAPRSNSAAAPLIKLCRALRGQQAVEAALSLVDDAGYALRAGYPLCRHVMPSPWFGERVEGQPPGPDDDLVEGELLAMFRKFESALAGRRG